jgi:hypothetical protein
MLQADTFRDKLRESGVLDPLGVHHEFAYGTHGRKLDFDLIAEDDPLYADWVSANVDSLRSFPALPRAVLGIANGTNRLATDVASELGITALYTEKVSPREVVLTSESIHVVRALDPTDEITALEDVGTSGGTTCSGLRDVQRYGAHNVNALISWQRTETLSALAAANILYRSIIFEPLPTYTPEQCMEIGYCAQGWTLIAHD